MSALHELIHLLIVVVCDAESHYLDFLLIVISQVDKMLSLASIIAKF